MLFDNKINKKKHYENKLNILIKKINLTINVRIFITWSIHLLGLVVKIKKRFYIQIM